MLRNFLLILIFLLISAEAFASNVTITIDAEDSHRRPARTHFDEGDFRGPSPLKKEFSKRYSNLTLKALVGFKNDPFLEPWCRSLEEEPLQFLLDFPEDRSIEFQFFVASVYHAAKKEGIEKERERTSTTRREKYQVERKKKRASKSFSQLILESTFESIRGKKCILEKQEKRKNRLKSEENISRRLFRRVLRNPEDSIVADLLKSCVYLEHEDLFPSDPRRTNVSEKLENIRHDLEEGYTGKKIHQERSPPFVEKEKPGKWRNQTLLFCTLSWKHLNSFVYVEDKDLLTIVDLSLHLIRNSRSSHSERMEALELILKAQERLNSTTSAVKKEKLSERIEDQKDFQRLSQIIHNGKDSKVYSPSGELYSTNVQHVTHYGIKLFEEAFEEKDTFLETFNYYLYKHPFFFQDEIYEMYKAYKAGPKEESENLVDSQLLLGFFYEASCDHRGLYKRNQRHWIYKERHNEFYINTFGRPLVRLADRVERYKKAMEYFKDAIENPSSTSRQIDLAEESFDRVKKQIARTIPNQHECTLFRV